mgnify:CR=1 FL=1
MLKNRGKGSMNETILLIEDNESIIMGLEYLLTEEQYTIFSGEKQRKKHRIFLPAGRWILCFLTFPFRMETDLICAGKIKEHDIAPVIFLTAKDEEKDVVLGFDLGADDYVIKPFRNRELVSRIRNVLRRTEKIPAADLWKYCGGTGHGQKSIGTGTDRGDKARIQKFL